MDYEIVGEGLGNLLKVKMDIGDYIYAEPSAFVSSTGKIEVTSKMYGGLLKGLIRSASSESLFINRIKAEESVEVVLGPPLISSIKALELDGDGYVLHSSTYMAHIGDGIEIGSKFGGLTSFLTGSGLFFSHVKGKGTVFIWGNGSIVERELKDGEVFYLDNGNFLAASDNMKMEKILITRGLVSHVVSGEGIVFKLTGPGKVYYSPFALSGIAKIIARMIGRR